MALAACGPSGGPFEAVVARYDRAADRYEPGVETVATLDDPSTLEGGAGRFRARGEVDFAVSFLLSPTRVDEDLRAVFWGEPGDRVHPALASSGDVVVALDYESFSLLSLYHHIEASEAFLESHGARSEEIEALDVLYLPNATLGDAEVVDNFFYVYGTRVLVALRMDRLDRVPLPQNEGVVAHEVTHALWDVRVLDEEARFRRLDEATDPVAVNLLDAMSEGTSDFVGAALTGDADFVRHSISSDLVCNDAPECLLHFPRGLAEPRPLDEDWITGANLPPSTYRPTAYRVGTTFASALWRASDDHDAMVAALVPALSDLGDRLRTEPPWENAPASFGPAWLLDPIVSRLDAETAASLCDLVAAELAPIAADVPSCGF